MLYIREAMEKGWAVDVAPGPMRYPAGGCGSLAVARAELEEVAQWNLLMREIVYDLAKTKPEEEDEYGKVVSLAAKQKRRRRTSDSDDTTAARDAV